MTTSSAGGGAKCCLDRDERGDQRARLALVAAAAGAPRDDQLIGRPGQGDVQQARLLGALGPGRRRTDRHESGLDAGDVHRVPLAALGAVEREELDAAIVAEVERIGRRDPRSVRRAVAERLFAEELEHRVGDSNLLGREHHSVTVGIEPVEQVVRPRTQPRRGSLPRGGAHGVAVWRAGAVDPPPDRDAGRSRSTPGWRRVGRSCERAPRLRRCPPGPDRDGR